VTAAECGDPVRAPVVLQPLLDALDHGADTLVVTCAELRVRYANRAARRLLGEAVAPGAPFTLGARATVAGFAHLTLADLQGDARAIELRVSSGDWLGEPALFHALRDVTQRRAAEQGLVLGRQAMEASANGIMIVDAGDPQQPIIYVNPAFERITGYRRGEAIGRNGRFLQGHERDQPSLRALREALAAGTDVSVVLRNYRKDGTPFWNELSVSPVRDAAGRVTHFVGIQNDVTERLRQEAELVRRSTHDELTDLPNRSVLLERLRQALRERGRAHGALALLLVDLDRFKAINDALGHDAGDEVLFETAARLRGCLGDRDTLARLNGDQFVALLPAREGDAAVNDVAQAMLRAVAEPYQVAGQTVFCTCSVGIAFAGDAQEEPAQLLQCADLAVHAAKRGGRNAAHAYSADMVQRASDRMAMRNALHDAIQRGELHLHYQPQLDVRSQRICGVEALVRWRHPTLGPLAPADFIPLAEETGQIVALGEWVMARACEQHRQWLDRGLIDGPVAVNVSVVQFRRAGFVDRVAEILARTGLPPGRLELELTESVMMERGECSFEALHRLRALGVRLSIDDFGTGFSSLGYLKRLPIDKIKIDRSFVRDITSDGDDAAITLGIIAMAHHLRMRVIAEGVETPAQLAYLRRHLCDEAQGFHVSAPLPPAALEAFLAAFAPPAVETAAGDDAAPPTLLLVDDEPNILSALTRTLRRDGYRIFTAGGADQAFQVLAQQEVQVILSDQRMPAMCGTDFLSEVKRLYPDTVRMVLSGYTDLQSVTEAINRGAIYRFLTKPWEDEPLRAHIREAFAHHQRERLGAALA